MTLYVKKPTTSRRMCLVARRLCSALCAAYPLDEQTVKTVLRLEEYGGEEDSAWVLLEPIPYRDVPV